MVIGLVACGTKTPAATDPTQGNDPTNAPTDPATPTVNEKPYKGQTIEVWGNTGQTDFESFGNGNYLWMMKAAMYEWAEANEVTLVFKNSYDVNQLLAAINAGETPDLTFHDNKYPASANYGLASVWTEAELAKISQYIDQQWLDLMTMGGKTYGFVYPWTGTFGLKFNQSMFERYDAKTPLEYFLEGNWNWTTLREAMRDVTKDLDGDGTIETYGLSRDSMVQGMTGGSFTLDEKGNLTMEVAESQHFFDYCEFYYTEYTINQTIAPVSGAKITTNFTYPMYAMQMSDTEFYNFDSVYKIVSNGDIIRSIPIPYYDGDTGTTADDQYWRKVTQSGCHILKSCDVREAVVDMLCYVLQCGDYYMGQMSGGDYKPKFEGLKGTCEYSKTYIEYFGEVLKTRKELYDSYVAGGDFDPTLYAKIEEFYKKCTYTQYFTFTGVTECYRETSTVQKNPAATAVETIKAKYKEAIDKYNSLYVFG